MKKSVLACIFFCFLMICGVSATDTFAYDTLDSLINRGLSIKNAKEYEAYVWVNDVSNFIENHSEYSYSDEILALCSSAKGYTSIDTFNSQNIIIGYLSYLKRLGNISDVLSPDVLIEEGKALTNSKCPDAYSWVLNVKRTNEFYSDSSVFDNLEKNCVSAIGYTSIDTFNTANSILADLITLDSEMRISSIFADLVIIQSPYKVDYIEDEVFSAEGVIVCAVYNNTYKDGRKKAVQKEITDYYVDTTTPLKISDAKWNFSYSVEGVTKTVSQDITVSEFLPDLVCSTLISISVSKQPKKVNYITGESFSPKGMKVDAKYKNMWSDGSVTYTIDKNIEYMVDENSALKPKDKKWAVSYVDNGVEVKTSIPIKVKDDTPTINYIKKTLVLGESVQLKIFGTSKYVMWKSDGSNAITIDDNGMIKAVHNGTTKVTATIGSGKKNIKLSCVVTVVPKITADKSILFLDLDQYETVKISTKKLPSDETCSIEVYGCARYVEGEANEINIIPEYAGVTFFNLYSRKNKGNYSTYCECSIPVIVYSKENGKKSIKLENYSINKTADGKILSFSISGTYISIKGNKLIKQFSNAIKETKTGIYSSYGIIDKGTFEKLMQSAVKKDSVTWNR